MVEICRMLTVVVADSCRRLQWWEGYVRSWTGSEVLRSSVVCSVPVSWNSCQWRGCSNFVPSSAKTSKPSTRSQACIFVHEVIAACPCYAMEVHNFPGCHSHWWITIPTQHQVVQARREDIHYNRPWNMVCVMEIVGSCSLLNLWKSWCINILGWIYLLKIYLKLASDIKWTL